MLQYQQAYLSDFPNIEENKRARISEELSTQDVSSLLLESSYAIYYDMLKTYNGKDPIDTIVNFDNESVDKESLRQNANTVIFEL